MEYYSAKKGTKLCFCRDVDGSRAVIPCVVSQKEKNKYHILKHICGI